MRPQPRETPGMACGACYYLVISSTHLSNGHFRRVKGVFRGPLCPTATSDSPERAERALGCSVEDLKALFYCELCDKQYLRHQEFDNHINSYDHAHKQRLKELKHREFARNVASKSWKDQRKQEKALRRLHKLAQLQQETQRAPGRTEGLRSAVRVVRHQRDRSINQRDRSPEDKPEPLRQTQRAPAAQPNRTNPRIQPEDLCQSPAQAPAESPLITYPVSNADPPAVTPQSRLGLYSQLPLPGRGRVGGRLGVSFCFSRRGPRLEPSACVFSDQEEEEREKRAQMKERIKGIIEDIDREIEAAERKHGESAEKKRGPDAADRHDTGQILAETAKDEEEIENRDMGRVIESQNHDSQLSLSQTQVAIWGTALAGAHRDAEHTDCETEGRQETGGSCDDSPHTCVLGKDGSTRLRWPVHLLKFTKSQPCISYSCNPLCINLRQAEDRQEAQQNHLCALSDESNPCVLAIPAADTHCCLQRQTRQEPRAHGWKEAEENVETEPRIDGETEAHLFLKNKNLSSSETGRCMLSMENCVRAASHPFDPAHSDSSDTNSQNPLGGRLGGARRIRERAITALSCKLESVTQPGTQRICISPSRRDCGSETMCECATASQLHVGASEVPRKKRRASTKKHKLGKRKRGEKEKASNKRQPARCKVRSVVSTVSTGREEAGGGWGKLRGQGETRSRTKRRRRREQRAGSSSLLGGCEAEPVSVSVRKRRPHRSHSPESQSQPGREQPRHCSASSQLARHTADRDSEREGKRDRDAVTFPWRARCSLHSFSPGCNSKLFWEGGHHSNPRSFIDCSYPDNSCASSPARKRKLLHGDRKFIHSNRKSLRRCGVWEETDSGGKVGGQTGCRDRGMISDTEQWEWMRGSCQRVSEQGRQRPEWKMRNRVVEWDWVSRFSPSPSSRGRRSRNVSTDDKDWDRCSLDRWTWGSSDSWEDRGTRRSTSGSRTGTDSRDSPSCVRRCASARHSSSRHLSSPEWWTSRQTYSPQSVCNTRTSRCHSPRSCSPCSSTSMSELSWEWSRSSTCSGVTVDGVALSSCVTSWGAPGPSPEAKKHSSSASASSSLTSFSHSSPHRTSPAPAVPGLGTHHDNDGLSLAKGPNSHFDLEPPAHVATRSSATTPQGLCLGESATQKAARPLLLPLIGKRPAIQRKAWRKKGLLEKSQEKEGEDEGEAKGSGSDTRESGQKCAPDMAESDLSSAPSLCPPEIRTDDKQTGGETALPISFTAEEMDKYRLLQEQAREHMQKVLEQTHEGADGHAEENFTPAESCGTSEERYTPAPLHSPPPLPSQSRHTDTMQTGRSLQAGLPLPHMSAQENYTQPVALGIPNLPPLPLSPPLSNLHHIILQHSSPSSSSGAPPSPAIHPHPTQLPHSQPPPLHPSLPPYLHLSPIAISSLFPSILLSHHPIPLLPPGPPFHTNPLAPLSTVALQPLNPQPFMDRAWPVRFQQKAL